MRWVPLFVRADCSSRGKNPTIDYPLGIFPCAAIGWFGAGQLFIRRSGQCYRAEWMSLINHSLLPASVYRLPKPYGIRSQEVKKNLNK